MADLLDRWVEELIKLGGEEEKMTEKRIKIIKAAVEIFSEKGYAAASTSEIAQKAGVAEGTIFRHYKTKKDLLLSIVTPITDMIAPFILRDFNKVLERQFPQFEDFVRAVIANRAEFVKKYLPVLKVLLQEIPFHPELHEQFKQVVGKQVIERFRQAVERYQQEGQIALMPPLSVIRMVASTVIGYFITRHLIAPDAKWDDEMETELIVRFILHGLKTS